MSNQSKRIVEVILKVVDQAGAAIKAASTSLRTYSQEEKKAATEAKNLNTTQEKTAASASKVSSSIKKVSTSEDKMSSSAKKATQDIKKLGTESAKTGKKVDGMGKDMMGSINTMMADFGTLVTTIGTIALPVISFGGFERSMAEVGAVAKATDGDLDKLTKRALELGSTSEKSASQVAQGMKYLSMAGLSVEQTYQSIGGVLDLAIAGNMELGAAADISTNILTGFGKSAAELGAVNNALVEAFTSTNSTLEELGHALAYVGPIAAGLGGDFNDLVSAVGLLHNAGLKGTMAGTALRGVLNTLFNPTKDEADQLKELSDRIGGMGLALTNSEGNFVGFEVLLGQLEQSGISAAEALALFGQRAGPGVAALLSQGSKALGELKNNLDLADAEDRAHALAETMNKNLVGSFRNLMSVVEGFMIRVGKKLGPAIQEGTDQLVKMVSHVNNLIDSYPELSGTIIKTTGAVLGLVAALSGLRLASTAASFLSPSMFGGAGASAGSSFVGSFIGKVGPGIQKFMPTLAGFFVSGSGSMIGRIGAGLVGGMGSVITYFTGLLSSEIPALASAGGSIAGSALVTGLLGAVGAAFAGYKIGTIMEPFISAIELPFTNLNVGELIQQSFGQISVFLNTLKNGFINVFYLIPKEYLGKFNATFYSWASGLVKLAGKIPGIAKLLGLEEAGSITATLDDLASSSSQMAADAIRERQEMTAASKRYQQVNFDTIAGIGKEGDAREVAYQKEKAIAAKKMKLYTDIESINTQFDPGIEKAAADLKNLEKQFYQFQGTMRTTADGLRSIVKGIGENIDKEIAGTFDNIDLDPDVKRWSTSLEELQRSYLKDTQGLEKAIRSAENKMGQARVDAVSQASAESIAIIESQTARQIEVEKAASVSIATTVLGRKREEEKLANAITALSAQGAEAKKKVYVKASEAIQAEIDKSITKERALADELKSLKDVLSSTISSLNSDERDLRRELMSPANAYRDALKEVQEVMSQGDRLASAGKTKEAVAAWKEAAALAKSTANEVKSGDNVIVSKASATNKALYDMESAENRIRQASQSAIASAAAQLQAQKQNTESLKSDLDSVGTKLVDLDKLTQEGVQVKIKIDLKSFERELNKLSKDKDAFVQVGIKYTDQSEVYSKAQQEKATALEELKTKYGDLITSSQDYANAVKNTATSVTNSSVAQVKDIGKVETSLKQLKESAKIQVEWSMGDTVTNANFDSYLAKLKGVKKSAQEIVGSGIEITPIVNEEAVTGSMNQAVSKAVEEANSTIQNTKLIPPPIEAPEQAPELKTFLSDIEEVYARLKSMSSNGVFKVSIDLDTAKIEYLRDFIKEVDGIEIEIVERVDDEEVKKAKKDYESFLDKLVTITLGTKGMEAMRDAKKLIDSIKSKTVTITTVNRTISARAGGGPAEPEHYANGGDVYSRLSSPIIRRGSGTKDDVPALLMKGEYVLKKSSVAKYGHDFLNMLNQGLLDPSKFMPQMYEAGGMVQNIGDNVRNLGRRLSLGMNSHTPFQEGGVTYNISSPTFHQHVGTKAAGLSTNRAKSRATNLLKSFTNILPNLAAGGSTDIWADFTTESNLISDQYNEEIAYAQATGDEEQANILLMEQQQIEQLSNDLALTLEQIRLDYEVELLDATNELADKVAGFEDDKTDAAVDYQDALAALNKERASIEFDYLKEKRALETEVSSAQKKASTYHSSSYTLGSKTYTPFADQEADQVAEISRLNEEISSLGMNRQASLDNIDSQEANETTRQNAKITTATARQDRAQSSFDTSSGLKSEQRTLEENKETSTTEFQIQSTQTEADFSTQKSIRDTSHIATKLGIELQLELLRLRQQYEALAAEQNTASNPSGATSSEANTLGIQYWLNKGGPVGYPRGKKRKVDSVLAALTPGEFVINEEAVQHYGADFIEALNKRELDPEFDDFPTIPPATIQGVTYHINAPSFHDKVAERTTNVASDMGQGYATRMVQTFRDAVPHLSEGGDIGTSQQQLTEEIDRANTEYSEKIQYANETGQSDLSYILQTEQLELAALAEELNYTLSQLQAERDYALTEAAMKFDSSNMENDMDYQQTLLEIQQDRIDAQMSLEDTLADAALEIANAQADKDNALAQYQSELSSYNSSNTGTSNSVAQSQTMRDFKQFWMRYDMGSDSDYSTGGNGRGEPRFDDARRITDTGHAPDGNPTYGTPGYMHNELDKIETEWAGYMDTQETSPAPVSPSTAGYEGTITRAQAAKELAQQTYDNMMAMYSEIEATNITNKNLEDDMSQRSLDFDIYKAGTEYDRETTSASTKNATSVSKQELDSSKEYADRERDMTHEVQLLEVELAKTLFDLRKQYSTTEVGSGVTHFLREGGQVNGPIKGMDSVRAMLTPGEFVIKEGVVRLLGADFFNKINNFQLPRMAFAEGGIVPGGASVSTPSMPNTLLGTVNLAAGGKTYPATMDRSMAVDLVKQFKKMGLSIA